MVVAVAGIVALGLAIVHVVAGRLRFLRVIPRSRWLSAASGVSVAYVFVHVLPDLAKSQEHVGPAAERTVGLTFLEHHAYLIALVGLATFYGLERLAILSRGAGRPGTADEEAHDHQPHDGDMTATPTGVFWVHTGSFAAYNALVGYLLLHREGPLSSTWVFGAAMATHFLVNDYGLHEHHKQRYARIGRWLLAGAVLLGWALGAASRWGWMVEVDRAATGMLFALLAGGIVLNTLKEELPEERQSNFTAFAVGAAAYAALLLTI